MIKASPVLKSPDFDKGLNTRLKKSGIQMPFKFQTGFLTVSVRPFHYQTSEKSGVRMFLLLGLEVHMPQASL